MKKYYFKCPRCHTDDSFHKISEESGTGRALLIFGGFLSALIYGARTSRRIQCSYCSHIFQQPKLPQSPISRLSTWIFFIMLISVSIMILFFFIPELSGEFRDIYLLNILSKFIESSPTGIALGMLVLFPSILILLTFASVISNYRFRKSFKSKYMISPESNLLKNKKTNMTINSDN